MTEITINRFSPHLIWIFGLLEMITVPLVVWLPQVLSLSTKSALEGAIVGFLGIIILFFILNRIIHLLKIKVEDQTVTNISILQPAIWNTLLLALIFGLQKMVALLQINSWLANCIIAGFISAGGAVLITLLLYRFLCMILPPLRITLKTTKRIYWIKSISVFTISLLAGLYEAIALPIILIWQIAETNVTLISALTGVAGGLTGSFIIYIIYNYYKCKRLTIILSANK